MYSLILHGTRLQKLRHLTVSLQKASSFSNPFSSATKGKTFTVSYLVGSLGFTTKLAESISKKVTFDNFEKPDSVLSLLKSHNFTHSQISNIIREYPQLLVLDTKYYIRPNLEFFTSREGVSSPEVSEIVSQVPKILGMTWENMINAYRYFVKEVIVADKSLEFGKLEGCRNENKTRNVMVLRELGVPLKSLFLLLTEYDGPIHGKERFEESVKKVVEMGYDPSSIEFVEGLRFVYGMSDKAVEEKANVYVRLGFTVEEVWEMVKKWKKIRHRYDTLKRCGGLLEDEIRLVVNKFLQCLGASEEMIERSVETFIGLVFSRDEYTMIFMRCPQCVWFSVETGKKKTEFLVKEMNWPLKALVSHPQVFNYSMEKRIVPRCNVIKALLSKGLLGSELPPISSVLATTNPAFLERYVEKHDDKELVAELMDIFTRKIVFPQDMVRIGPRCNVIEALMSKGLLGSEPPPISSVLGATNQAFLERYVEKYDDKELVAELMDIFTGKIVFPKVSNVEEAEEEFVYEFLKLI